jgi:hypothetical protein
LEHDRVIRLLQTKFRRKYEAGMNPGAEQNAAVGAGASALYPDLVLLSQERGRRLQAVVEVETGESVNHLEALAQWAHYARTRAAFHLYVPAGMVDVARRLCEDNKIYVSEIWSYHTVGDQVRFTLVHRNRELPPAPPRERPAPRPSASRTAAPRKKALTRDKRGYEHFYLVDTTPTRRGKPRNRVLYWFRTPPNVKVGREPFTDSVRRELESQNPDVQFDWVKILATPIPSADVEKWRERRRAEKAAKAARRALDEPLEEAEEPEAAEIAADSGETTVPAETAAEPQAAANGPAAGSADRARRRRRRRRGRDHHPARPEAEQAEAHADQPSETPDNDEPVEDEGT